ncbi:MAG: UbiX family flavin prenyltransferase [Euryarchaeota archaeon]|nr:UbiX family flavin prenyltransferase [Euryarchaeota archaeon]
MKIVTGITGASGSVYGVRLAEFLSKKVKNTIIVSETAEEILQMETNYNMDYLRNLSYEFYLNSQMDAKIASGSNFFDAFVICPCTVSTMSKIASGIGSNLITRTAAVALKEKRKMILAIRETPLSSSVLENMLKLSREGVVILPTASPFYIKPRTVEDMIEFVVGKILDHLKIEHELYNRY